VEGVWVMSDVARKLIRMRDPWIFKWSIIKINSRALWVTPDSEGECGRAAVSALESCKGCSLPLPPKPWRTHICILGSRSCPAD
jgi:hypothetical protein